jgi:hypothetical protein
MFDSGRGTIAEQAKPMLLSATAVFVMALTLFRPSSGIRIVLFTILVGFAALMAMDMSLKELVTNLAGSY